MNAKTVLGAAVLLCLPFALSGQEKQPGLEPDVLFCIGWPDAVCSELALAKSGGYPAYPEKIVGITALVPHRLQGRFNTRNTPRNRRKSNS
jgi:hypothetical protein